MQTQRDVQLAAMRKKQQDAVAELQEQIDQLTKSKNKSVQKKNAPPLHKRVFVRAVFAIG